MKVTLEFNTDDPQQAKELKLLIAAEEMQIALWDIMQMFRNAMKYEGYIKKGKYLTDAEYNLAETFQKNFFEILDDYNLQKMIEEQA